MFGFITVGWSCACSLLFVPEIDIGSLPPPGSQSATYTFVITFKLQSGNTVEFSDISIGTIAGAANAWRLVRRILTEDKWVYRTKGMAVTVLSFRGQQVVGVNIASDGPMPAVRYVPRAAPPEKPVPKGK